MSTPTQNKVFFGLAEAFWAPVTENKDPQTGEITTTYGSYESMPGFVSISQDPQGSRSVFRADDSDFYVTNPNSGYSGAVKFARFSDSFREYAFGEKRDADGIGYETSESGTETKYFAFAFRFKGDKKNIRHVFYKCSVTRPSIGSETTPEGDTPNINGEEVTLTSVPRSDPDGLVRSWADPITDTAKYDSWYSSVMLPSIVSPTPTPTYTYTAVEPVGSENPKEEGWYVLSGDNYIPTNDTTVDENKTYYERTEED